MTHMDNSPEAVPADDDHDYDCIQRRVPAASCDCRDSIHTARAHARAHALAYWASDGSIWHLEAICPPIPVRGFDWSAVHEEYDGAPDAHDDRHVYGATRAEAIEAVEVYVAHAHDEEPLREHP